MVQLGRRSFGLLSMQFFQKRAEECCVASQDGEIEQSRQRVVFGERILNQSRESKRALQIVGPPRFDDGGAARNGIAHLGVAFDVVRAESTGASVDRSQVVAPASRGRGSILAVRS